MRGLAAASRLQGQHKSAIKHLERVLEISKEMQEYTGGYVIWAIQRQNQPASLRMLFCTCIMYAPDLYWAGFGSCY
jgi:hypothetical protein